MYGCVQQFFNKNSSTFNPLATIQNQNKLVGSNYVDWKRHLDIILTTLGYKYVLTTLCPQEPEPNTLQYQKDLYTKWLKVEELAKCYMQASMSSILQHRHESFKSASDIISNLNEMVGDQSGPARQPAMRIVMSTKMTDGTPVQDHVLKMMDSLNELDVLGAEIDAKSQLILSWSHCQTHLIISSSNTI